MNIADDLVRAFNDGYERGKAEAEAYLLHCGDETPVTNGDRIRTMSDEEMARFFADDWCEIVCGSPAVCDGNCEKKRPCVAERGSGMSVIIKNAKLPKDCPMCPLAHWNKLDVFTGCEQVTGKKYAVLNDEEYANSKGRPEWCPLFEVTTFTRIEDFI